MDPPLERPGGAARPCARNTAKRPVERGLRDRAIIWGGDPGNKGTNRTAYDQNAPNTQAGTGEEWLNLGRSGETQLVGQGVGPR